MKFFPYILSLTIAFTGCERFVDVDPPSTSLTDFVVYESDATAAAVINDLYDKIGSAQLVDGIGSLTLFGGLSADELDVHPAVTDQSYISFVNNNINTRIRNIPAYWTSLYRGVYVANTAIEGITNSPTITQKAREQLIGEAKFLRAFYYFHLVNLFGDVPLNLNSDYKVNALKPRTDKRLVYDQIVADLKDAQQLLTTEFRNSAMVAGSDRTRPNRYAATALLSRVYLYTGDYEKAEQQSASIIDEKSVFDTVAVDKVFLMNSMETVWALQSTSNNFSRNTGDARRFVLSTGNSPENAAVHLRKSLQDAFVSSDKRRSWIGSYTDPETGDEYLFPYKYKIAGFEDVPTQEYLIVLRLSEQYFIRAEARARRGNFTGAAEDLDMIRRRAGLPNTTAADETSLLNAILDERRHELFSEWGHRWLDLKRLGKATEILQPLKGSNWQPEDALYPIPQTELDANPSIRDHQNPGY